MVRRTSVRLLASGIALTLLFAVLWTALRGSKGTRYYFPPWQLGQSSYEALLARREGLTNVAAGLPVVLPVLDRSPSRLGLEWEKWREKLPDRLSEHLPIYLGPRADEACGWLAGNAHEPEVARAVAARWPGWRTEVQEMWITSLGNSQTRNRPEYLPMLETSIRSTNADLSGWSAHLLASYRPLGSTNAQRIAAWMNRRVTLDHSTYSRAVDSYVIAQLAADDPPSRIIISAFTNWLHATDVLLAARAGLFLAQVAPGEFPGEAVVLPRLHGLNPADRGLLLRDLGKPEFRRVAASPWHIQFWSRQLRTAADVGQKPPNPASLTAGIAQMLGQVGSAAASAVPVLMPLLASTNQSVVNSTVFALVSMVSPSPELVAPLTDQLTNATVAGDVLLWLASGGTRSRAAEPAITALADDKVSYPQPYYVTDAVLAKRYGLIPRSSPSELSAKNLRKPSAVMVVPNRLPPTLLALWPDPKKRDPAEMTQAAQGDWRDGYPPVSLATLARHCLDLLNTNPPPMR